MTILDKFEIALTLQDLIYNIDFYGFDPLTKILFKTTILDFNNIIIHSHFLELYWKSDYIINQQMCEFWLMEQNIHAEEVLHNYYTQTPHSVLWNLVSDNFNTQSTLYWKSKYYEEELFSIFFKGSKKNLSQTDLIALADFHDYCSSVFHKEYFNILNYNLRLDNSYTVLNITDLLRHYPIKLLPKGVIFNSLKLFIFNESSFIWFNKPDILKIDYLNILPTKSQIMENNLGLGELIFLGNIPSFAQSSLYGIQELNIDQIWNIPHNKFNFDFQDIRYLLLREAFEEFLLTIKNTLDFENFYEIFREFDLAFNLCIDEQTGFRNEEEYEFLVLPEYLEANFHGKPKTILLNFLDQYNSTTETKPVIDYPLHAIQHNRSFFYNFQSHKFVTDFPEVYIRKEVKIEELEEPKKFIPYFWEQNFYTPFSFSILPESINRIVENQYTGVIEEFNVWNKISSVKTPIINSEILEIITTEHDKVKLDLLGSKTLLAIEEDETFQPIWPFPPEELNSMVFIDESLNSSSNHILSAYFNESQSLAKNLPIIDSTNPWFYKEIDVFWEKFDKQNTFKFIEFDTSNVNLQNERMLNFTELFKISSTELVKWQTDLITMEQKTDMLCLDTFKTNKREVSHKFYENNFILPTFTRWPYYHRSELPYTLLSLHGRPFFFDDSLLINNNGFVRTNFLSKIMYHYAIFPPSNWPRYPEDVVYWDYFSGDFIWNSLWVSTYNLFWDKADWSEVVYWCFIPLFWRHLGPLVLEQYLFTPEWYTEANYWDIFIDNMC